MTLEISMIQALLAFLTICLLLVIRLRVLPKTDVRFQWSVGLPTQQTIENELNQKRHATHIRQDQTTPDHPERNH
jgi:hypothetical protein